MIKSHRDLRVWREGMDLSLAVYKATESLPKSEVFGLSSQMRRAASSIPANIAEGFSRQHQPEFLQHLHIAKGSLSEVDTLLELSHRLGYIDEVAIGSLGACIERTGKMLHKLIASVRANKSG